MRKILYIISFVMLLGCKEQTKETSEVAHTHQVALSNELMLSESQIALANIKTQNAGAGVLEKGTTVNARLVSNEELTEMVSARVQGRLEKLFVKETGKPIRKGDPLYEIYSESLLTLQNDFLLAQAQYEEFKNARYEEYLKSARKKLILYGLTEQQVDALGKTKVVQTRVTFLSPATGIIEEISVAEGQYVEEGDVLYKLENTSKLWVEAELYPGESNGIQVGSQITIVVNGFENKSVQSKVLFVSPEYRANTQIMIIRASLDNESRQWKSGMQAQVLLKSTHTNSISVPVEAVIRDQQGAYVFIKTGENTFAPRSVITGIENFSSIEIKEGISGGEQLVVSGAYLLYSELILKNGNETLVHIQHQNK